METEGGKRITKRAEVDFEWRIEMCGYDERCLARLVCEDACRQSVPFPERWLTAMRCVKLRQLAHDTVEEVGSKTIATNLESVFLGVPKDCGVPERGVEGCIGSVAALKNDRGQRNDYILCARIDHERWLCHQGTLADGTLDEENPFNQEGLIEKDIRRDAFSDNCAPRRRVGPRGRGNAAVPRGPAADRSVRGARFDARRAPRLLAAAARAPLRPAAHRERTLSNM